MAPVRFGFIMPAEFADRSRYVENINNALELASGAFESAWMMDHLQPGELYLLDLSCLHRVLDEVIPAFKT